MCPLVREQIGGTEEKASRTIAFFQGINDGICTDFILNIQFQTPNTSTASFKLAFWVTKRGHTFTHEITCDNCWDIFPGNSAHREQSLCRKQKRKKASFLQRMHSNQRLGS